MSAHNLKVKDQRRRLKPRREPYWLDIGKGCGLGFRRGPDTWVARWHDPATKKHLYFALKDAQEYAEAFDAAQAWWRTISNGASGSVVRGTVADALKAYIQSKRDHGRDADDIERRVGLTVEGTPFASIKLEQLTRDAVMSWRTKLCEGRANRTTNREVRAVIAGLNWSVKHGGFAGNPLAWALQPLADDVDDEPDQAAVFLSPEQRASLLAVCDEGTRNFLRGLEATGARPGELAAATVADFNNGKLTLRSKKGRGGKLRVRSIEMGTEGTAFFAKQCRDKTPAAPIFAVPETGAAWVRHQWAKMIRFYIQEANKKLKGAARIPVQASAYSFRHASIAEMLQVLDPVTTARHHGTSVAMIERTYFKFIPGSVRAALDSLKVAK